jgi:hypothetical protein
MSTTNAPILGAPAKSSEVLTVAVEWSNFREVMKVIGPGACIVGGLTCYGLLEGIIRFEGDEVISK